MASHTSGYKDFESAAALQCKMAKTVGQHLTDSEQWSAKNYKSGGYIYKYEPAVQEAKEFIVTTMSLETPANVELTIGGILTWKRALQSGVHVVPTPKLWDPSAPHQWPIFATDAPCTITTTAMPQMRNAAPAPEIKGQPIVRTLARDLEAKGGEVLCGGTYITSVTVRAKTLSKAQLYLTPRVPMGAIAPELGLELLIGSQQTRNGTVTFEFPAPIQSREVAGLRVEVAHNNGAQAHELRAETAILASMML